MFFTTGPVKIESPVKIELEFLHKMFSGFGTAIESAAIINSGKAAVIQE